jgi:TM2 domain-containing membrane protein YozV
MPKFCPNCGTELKFENAEICPSCGVRIKEAPSTPLQASEKKSPGFAAVLSFLIPGLGQIYNGQIGKGIIMVVAAVIFALLIIILIGIILYLALWLYGIYDAYDTAKKINSGEISD